MSKYTFTTAAGNRIVEKCLAYNKEMCLGCITLDYVEACLREEEFRSEYAVGHFIRWLHIQCMESDDHVRKDVQRNCAKVLGLVAIGMADAVRSDREFIGKVEALHAAMNTRFGVDSSDIWGEDDE